MAQPPIYDGQLGIVDAELMNGETPDHYSGYDLAFFIPGKVTSTSQVVGMFAATRQFTIPDIFVGSSSISRTVTSGSQNFTITHYDPSWFINIGLLQFSAATNTGVFLNDVGAGPFVVTPGQWIRITSSTADANQEDISIVIKAEVS